MGPLVPDIISNNLNLIVALIIGILFGAILEQAGFSTSKKLVGLFYGYDFTVLRVFFTAGIVAMIGVMAFAHFGLLDLNLIYINPTFLWSAIIGGLIMGLGFVVGGFCPGTSVCAAAIGKIDALIFIGGAFIGVLVFAEGYPLFKPLYLTASMGIPRFYEIAVMPESLFAFLMVAFALIAFWATSIIENKVNGIRKPAVRFTRRYLGMAALGLLLAVSAFAFTDRKEALIAKTEDSDFIRNYPVETITPDEFALCLLKTQECDKLQIFDFRPTEEYQKMSLPRSILFTVDNLFEKEPAMLLRIKYKERVFIADDEPTERKMAMIASELGFSEIKILAGGLEGFKEQILDFKPIENPKTTEEIDSNRFRAKAAEIIPVLIQNNKPKGPVQKKLKRTIGGC